MILSPIKMWVMIIGLATLSLCFTGTSHPTSTSDDGICTLTTRSQANQRAMATRSSYIIARLQPGTILQGVARVNGRDGFVWWQLADASYIRNDLVNSSASCQHLPFIMPDHMQYDIYGNEATLDNTILITIDDASIEFNVRWAFELLNNRGVKATFFPILRHVRQQDPQLWRDIALAGFEIGYHTTQHISRLSYQELVVDFEIFTTEMRQITGIPDLPVRVVRAPAGVWDANWLHWCVDHRLYNIRWNVIMPMQIETILQSVNHPRMGGILLFHTDRQDIQWLQDNIDGLLQLRTADNMPYRISTVSQALSD